MGGGGALCEAGAVRRAVIFGPEAQEELDEAYAWYESLLEGLGDELLIELRRILDGVQIFPDAYPLVYQHFRRALVPRFPYSIYYRASADQIEVVAVYHGHRRPSGWRDRL